MVAVAGIIDLVAILLSGIFLVPTVAGTRTRLRVGQECLSVGSGIVVLRQNFRTGKKQPADIACFVDDTAEISTEAFATCRSSIGKSKRATSIKDLIAIGIFM